MSDHNDTEFLRKLQCAKIDLEIASDDPDLERKRLEDEYGKVWNTKELQEDFKVHSFMAPFCKVTRKSDNKRGIIGFQHLPRFYFRFVEE